MRLGQGLLFGLLTGLVAGCASEPTHSTSWMDRFRHGAVPSGPDVVLLDIAMIERPHGDKYLNGELWESVDETIALESKEALASNGFRTGQTGGITPIGLQELLSSSRSCPHPQRVHVHAGRPLKLDLGPEMQSLRFQLQRDRAPVPVGFEQAQCTLEVVPTLAADGRIRLHFEPQIQHGRGSLLPQPAADHSGWVLKPDRPTERYQTMSWEVTLAANEYVVVGGRFDLPQTLGHQCFLRRDEQVPVQRLLVIRTSRSSAPADDTVGLMADPDSILRAPSLASQASFSRSTARGKSD